MTTAIDTQKSSKFGIDNKIIGIGVAVYSLIEAILAYFFFFKPLYIDPVYLKCDEYNADGITCLVKLFGKTLASPDEIANNQVILSLWDTISNILLIYLVFTVSAIVLAFCLFKGMSFAQTYLTAVFGAKHVIGIVALVVPMVNTRRSAMYFGIVDALFAIAICLYFVTLCNDEYADDMLLTPEQVGAMNKRMKLGFILYAGILLFAVFEKLAMPVIGKNVSLFLDWQEKSTALTQGIVLVVLISLALIAAIVYVKEADWAMFFFAAFGTAAAVSNIVAIINRLMWMVNTYNPLASIYNSGNTADPYWPAAETLMTTGGAISSSWIGSMVCLVLATLASVAVAGIAIIKILPKLKFKFAPDDKKPAFAVFISAGSVMISFILTVAALALYISQRNPGFAYGAMDYMYFIVYGGISLFLAMAMMGGYSFTKIGALGLFIVVAASNFSTIFSVLQHRDAYVAANAANGLFVVGYNHIAAVVMLVLSIVSCFGIVAAFAVKGVDDYMYEKRFC